VIVARLRATIAAIIIAAGSDVPTVIAFEPARFVPIIVVVAAIGPVFGTIVPVVSAAVITAAVEPGAFVAFIPVTNVPGIFVVAAWRPAAPVAIRMGPE
jgi:hypothetical protein